MAYPYYQINNVDILPFIQDEGLQIEENDIDAEGSGRYLDGEMERRVVARKDKHTIKCMPLSTANANTVLQALSSGEYVTVQTNVHPKHGTVIKTMYNSARTAAVLVLDESGNAVWNNISFTLIER